MTMPAKSSPAPRFRKAIRAAIRSIASNGRPLGSLKRRLRNCIFGMRAEPYDYDDPRYVALELHLMERAKGMALDAPAVRP